MYCRLQKSLAIALISIVVGCFAAFSSAFADTSQADGAGAAGSSGSSLVAGTPQSGSEQATTDEANTVKIKEGTYFIKLARSPKAALAVPSSSTSSGKQIVKSKFNVKAQNERFYLRNESDGTVLLQSAASGKYLCDEGGKVVQRPYAEKATLHWQVFRDSGYVIKNCATGGTLAISGGKAVTSRSTSRWLLKATDLVASGQFSIRSAVSGKVLAVEKSSMKSGAALIVQKDCKSGAEAFEVKSLGKNGYRILNAASGKAIGVKGGSKAEGAAIVQLDVKNTAALKWRASLYRSGALVFTNVASKKVLTVSGGGKNGARVKSRAGKGAASQSWTIAKSDYSLTGDRALDASIAKILKNHTTLSSCFSYVVHFSYRSGSKYGKAVFSDKTTRSMAKEMIQRHSGNCYRFAALFSWLARGLGYKTNVRAGYVPSASGGWAPHGWVEVYVNGKTYVCDPDLAHEMPGHHWFMTTYGGAPCSYSR